MKIRINCWKILLRQSAAKDFMFYDIYTKETKKKFLNAYFSKTKNEVIEDLNISESDFNKLELMLKLRNKSSYFDLPDEKWISLENIGFPLYFISNKGRLRRLNRIKSQVLTSAGYYKVNLYNLNKVKTICVHRLVLMSFTNNWETDLTVNHINRVRTDNRLENLEWATFKEQAIHRDSFEDTRIKNSSRVSGELNPCAKITNSIAISIYKEPHNISNREIATKYNAPYETVRTIRKGEAWKNITQGSTTRENLVGSSDSETSELLND